MCLVLQKYFPLLFTFMAFSNNKSLKQVQKAKYIYDFSLIFVENQSTIKSNINIYLKIRLNFWFLNIPISFCFI